MVLLLCALAAGLARSEDSGAGDDKNKSHEERGLLHGEVVRTLAVGGGFESEHMSTPSQRSRSGFPSPIRRHHLHALPPSDPVLHPMLMVCFKYIHTLPLFVPLAPFVPCIYSKLFLLKRDVAAGFARMRRKEYSIEPSTLQA